MATNRRRSTAEDLLSGQTSLSGQHVTEDSRGFPKGQSGTTGTGRVTEEKNYNEQVNDRDEAEDNARPSAQSDRKDPEDRPKRP